MQKLGSVLFPLIVQIVIKLNLMDLLFRSMTRQMEISCSLSVVFHLSEACVLNSSQSLPVFLNSKSNYINDYVLIAAPPRFNTVLSSISVGYIGLETKLTCDIVGYPSPKIIWRRSNQLAVSGPRFSVSRNTVTIQRTRETDTGSYMCQGSNILGTTLDMTFLKVKNAGTCLHQCEMQRFIFKIKQQKTEV